MYFLRQREHVHVHVLCVTKSNSRPCCHCKAKRLALDWQAPCVRGLRGLLAQMLALVCVVFGVYLYLCSQQQQQQCDCPRGAGGASECTDVVEIADKGRATESNALLWQLYCSGSTCRRLVMTTRFGMLGSICSA